MQRLGESLVAVIDFAQNWPAELATRDLWKGAAAGELRLHFGVVHLVAMCWRVLILDLIEVRPSRRRKEWGVGWRTVCFSELQGVQARKFRTKKDEKPEVQP
jgi:hypothetical protein